MSKYDRDLTPAEEDYREVVRNHYLDAKEEARRQALEDSFDGYPDDENDYDDGCPLCGRLRCSGYCQE